MPKPQFLPWMQPRSENLFFLHIFIRIIWIFGLVRLCYIEMKYEVYAYVYAHILYIYIASPKYLYAIIMVFWTIMLYSNWHQNNEIKLDRRKDAWLFRREKLKVISNRTLVGLIRKSRAIYLIWNLAFIIFVFWITLHMNTSSCYAQKRIWGQGNIKWN